MKTLVICVAAFASFSAIGESKTNVVPRQHNIPEAVLRKTGGIVEKKGLGKIVIVNCQSRITESLVKDRMERLARLMKCAFEFRNGTWNISAPNASDANIAIYIVDDPKLPMSLVAAEAGWGVVNTVGLEFGERFSRQLTRVFALTAGAMCSMNVHSPMQPLTKVEDLDKLLSDNIMRDMIDAIRHNMRSRGITQNTVSSYLKACEQGWAPAPTNDVQRAIWEQVRADKERGPAKPILILPPGMGEGGLRRRANAGGISDSR